MAEISKWFSKSVAAYVVTVQFQDHVKIPISVLKLIYDPFMQFYNSQQWHIEIKLLQYNFQARGVFRSTLPS